MDGWKFAIPLKLMPLLLPARVKHDCNFPVQILEFDTE